MKKNSKNKIINITFSSIISIIFVFSIMFIGEISKYFFFPIFLILNSIVYNIVTNKLIKEKLNIRKIIILFIISLLLVLVHTNQLFYDGEEIVLIPSQSQTNDKTNEVWLCDLYGRNNNIEIVESTEWVFKDNCWVYNGINRSSLIIDSDVSEKVNLLFVKHSYSSAVDILTDNTDIYVDLYSIESGSESVSVSTNIEFVWNDFAILKTILCTISLTIIFYLLSLYNEKTSKAVIISFIISNVLYLTLLNKIAAVILCILYMLCLYCFLNNFKKMYNCFNKFEKILFYIITFCINFLSFGSVLFLNNYEIAYDISVTSLILFIHTFVIVMCIETTVFFIFNLISEKLIKSNNKKEKTNYLYFLLSFCSLLIWAVAFYPGNLSPDSISQLYSSINGPINDAHPAIMTILLGILFKTTKNVFTYIIIQDLLFSLMLSKIFNYCRRKGVNNYLLICLSIVIPLIPNIGISSTTIWKDIIYSISLTFLSYYVYRIVIKDDDALYNIFDILLFIISFVFTKEFRHNGLVPFIFVTILLLILSIIRKNKKLLILLIISVILSTFGIKVLYKAYKVEHYSLGGSVYNSVVRNFAATIYYDKDLSEEAYKLIQPIGDKEYFKKYYHPTNIDYLFYNSDDSVDKWLKAVNNYSITKVLPIYLKNIIKNPDVFIRDRYDSMAIMIDESYTIRYNDIFAYYDGIYSLNNKEFVEELFGDLEESNYGYIANNRLASLIRKIINFTVFDTILSQLFWKSGLFFTGYLLLFVYLIIKKKPVLILGMTPIIGNTLSWFLVLNHPSVRYVYYLNMSFIFMLLLSLVALKEVKK